MPAYGLAPPPIVVFIFCKKYITKYKFDGFILFIIMIETTKHNIFRPYVLDYLFIAMNMFFGRLDIYITDILAPTSLLTLLLYIPILLDEASNFSK